MKKWSGKKIYEAYHEDVVAGKFIRKEITWDEVGAKAGMSGDAARSRYRRYAQKTKEDNAYADINQQTARAPEFTIEGNTAYLSVIDEVVVSPDRLIEIAGIDMEEWMIDNTRMEVRSWGQHSKAHGYKTLYYVKVPFMRRVPIPIKWPLIRPAQIDWDFDINVSIKEGLRKVLVVPDIQIGYNRNIFTGDYIPFHDRDAVSVVLAVAKETQPNEIHIAADMFDLAELSDRFTPSPEHFFTMQAALIEGAFILKAFRECVPSARIVLYEGNHEARFGRNISKVNQWACELHRVDELSGPPVLSIPYLLSLNSMGIEWEGGYPDSYRQLNQKVGVKHGNKVRAASGATAKLLAGTGLESWVFGHTHRMEMVSETRFLGGERHVVVAASAGCLCKTDGSVPGADERRNWQQGFAEVLTHGTEFQITLTHINDAAALHQGNYYEADEFSKEAEQYLWDQLRKIEINKG